MKGHVSEHTNGDSFGTFVSYPLELGLSGERGHRNGDSMRGGERTVRRGGFNHFCGILPVKIAKK